MSDAYQQVIDALSSCRRVLVTTHVRPDGDALGSVAAMVLGMKKKGIDSHVLLLSHLPRKYSFIFSDNQIAFTDLEGSALSEPRSGQSPTLHEFDALLVMDTGTWSQLPGLQEHLANFEG